MRVLHLVYKAEIGGAQNIALEIAGGFPGSAVASFCGDWRNMFPEKMKRYGVRSHRLSDSEGVYEVMHSGLYDLLHVHWWPDMTGALDWEKLMASVPMVVTNHHMGSFPVSGCNLVCVSDVQQRLQREPSSLIINGIDCDRFETDRDYNPTRRLRVGFVSRLDQKLERQAMRILRTVTGNNEVDFVVIGDGDYLDLYRSEARFEGMNVDFRGAVWDVENHLKDIDLFVYPTRDDVLPTVILEAMASGIPVVAPPIGGIVSLLEGGRGCCVGWDEAGGAVNRLLNDCSLRTDMGASAARYVRTHYGLESMREGYRDLYRSLEPKIVEKGADIWTRSKKSSDKSVSVVIPTYRRPEACLRAVRSMRKQDMPVEVVVALDGDRESDYSLVRAECDIFVELEHNSGLSAARNAGIEAASGEYIGFCDDDDQWYPWTARSLAETLDSGVDVAYCAGYITEGRRKVHMCTIDFDPELLHSRQYIQISSSMIRASVLYEVDGFDEAMHQNGMRGPEDWEMWLRLSLSGHTFKRCPVVGMIYEGAESSTQRLTNEAWKSGMMCVGYNYINEKLGTSVR